MDGVEVLRLAGRPTQARRRWRPLHARP